MKKFLLYFYIILFISSYHLFAQDTESSSSKSIVETVREINESIGLGDIKKIIVFPILNNEPVLASLLAKNLFKNLQEKNIGKTSSKYLFGVEISKSQSITDALETYKEEEKHAIAVVVQILGMQESKTSNEIQYTIAIQFYRNASNDLIQETEIQGTRASILGVRTTSLLDNLSPIIAALEQQSKIPDDVSLIRITPRQNDLEKYIIKVDGTELITHDKKKHIAYFPSGNHTIRIYQIIRKEDGDEEVEIKTIKTKKATTIYETTVDFIDATLFEANSDKKYVVDVALLAGYQFPFLNGGDNSIENGSFVMELQANIDISSIPLNIDKIDISALPLYFGLSLLYTPLNNINAMSSALPNFSSNANDTRQMIAPLLRVGYRYEIIEEKLMVNAGIRGGSLFYSLPYSENALLSGSLLPAFGIDSNAIFYPMQKPYRISHWYITGGMAVLYSDVSYAMLTSVASTEGSDYIKENESHLYLLPTLSLGTGWKF